MATNTTNLGLIKPDVTDKYDINIQNSNMDIIDTINENKGKYARITKTSVQSISTANTRFIVEWQSITGDTDVFSLSNNKVTIKKSGPLLIKANLQVNRTDATYIYLAKNGIDIQSMQWTQNVPTLMWFGNVSAGDYFELGTYFGTSTGQIQMAGQWTNWDFMLL